MLKRTIAIILCTVLTPAVALAQTILVNVQPVVLQAPSGLELSTGAPPASDAAVNACGAFVVELWAQQANADPLNNGLACVFSDVTFNNLTTTCNGSSPGTFYNFFASGTCDNTIGLVDELGGCTFSPGVGITPEWVRIATFNMTADTISVGNVVGTAASASGVSLVVGGIVWGGTVSPARISSRSCTFDMAAVSAYAAGSLVS